MRRCAPWIGLLVLLGLVSCDKQTKSRTPGAENHSPQVVSVSVRPTRVLASEQVLVSCTARDADQDFLKYWWTAAAGDFPSGNQLPTVTWAAPPQVGLHVLKVFVTDFVDTVNADLNIDIKRVDPPSSLLYSNGINVVTLTWPGVTDSTVEGWSGYEVFVAPQSMAGMPEAELLTHRVSPGAILGLSFRVTPLEQGDIVYCQIRSRRDYGNVTERSADGPEISTAVRLDGFARDPASGETIPLYEVKSRRGAFGLHIPGGQIEPLDPDQRDRFDLYLGSSDAEDGSGEMMLKSPSLLAYLDPTWSGRVTGFWKLDGDWSTPEPPESPPLTTQVPVQLNSVYGFYSADGHYGKIWVLADDRTGVFPNRRIWIKWAWQPIPGYPRF